MATQNNIYMTAGSPVIRYRTVPEHGITGWRLNPDDSDKKVQFELTRLPEPEFDYERDVIELYSDKEVKFFKQANKYLFQSGFLVEFHGEPEPLDTTNMLTDDEVLSIATERNAMRLKKRVEELTSRVSVQRIYDIAKEVGRPAKTLEVIKSHLDSL